MDSVALTKDMIENNQILISL